MAPGNIFYESTLPQISPPSVTFIYEATGRCLGMTIYGAGQNSNLCAKKVGQWPRGYFPAKTQVPRDL
jgi:hypothetical protein